MIRLRDLLLLCLPLGACSSVGFGAQRSVEAAGVAATSTVATPVVGFASWPLWHWLGSAGSEALTGTEEIRVPIQPQGGGAPPQSSHSMNLEIIILLLVVGAGARELWSLKAKDKEQQRQLDELWDRMMEK